MSGEGMKTFYARILKQFTEKYIKKWSSKVGVVELPEVEDAGREMWGFDVTPAMKAAVMGRGQPLFQSNIPRRERPDYIGLTPTEQAEVDRQRADVRAKYEGTDQWMKAPNGELSNLSEEDWLSVRTEFFKKWFGDWEKVERQAGTHVEGDSAPVTPTLTVPSMISRLFKHNTPASAKSQVGLLDENGEPLLIFHGTPDRFSAFARGDVGFHFGTREQAEARARRIAEEKGLPESDLGVYAGFLNLRSPLVLARDYGSWEPKNFAYNLLKDYREGNAPLSLTESDIKFLEEMSHRTLDTDEQINKARGEFRSWLDRKGYDGIAYQNGHEGKGLSYMVLNSSQFKEEQNLGTFRTGKPNFYKQSDQTGHRGALTSLNDDWEATMALFDSADGSTVVHETAHFIFDMMEKFVENGLGDERMQSDYQKLVAWMILTPEQAAKGYEAYLKTVPEGTDAMTLEQWKYIEEQERLARGFEAYCMEGRAPSVELQGAFATLCRILLHIYKTVRALGVQLTDDVRQVFDGMLATETTLLRDSILLEAAEQIDKELALMEKRDACSKHAYRGLRKQAPRTRMRPDLI